MHEVVESELILELVYLETEKWLSLTGKYMISFTFTHDVGIAQENTNYLSTLS